MKAKHEIRLLGDRVLVKLLKPEQHSHGLWIPDSAKRSAGELWRGEVVACGPGSIDKKGRLHPCEVQPGDVVGFYWMAGKVDVTKYPTEDHRIILESAIQVVYS